MGKLFIIYLPFCIPFFCQIFQLSACQVHSSSTINQSNIQNAGVSLSLFFHIFRSFSFSSIYLFLLSSILSSVDLSIFIPFFFICSSFPSSSLHSISYYHNHIYFEPFLFLCLKFWSFIIFVCLLSFFHVLFNSLNYPWMAQMQGNFVKYVHTVEFRIPWKCAYFSVKIQFLKPIH